MPIAMIVHGGAWAIPDDQVEPHISGCRAALELGWSVLEDGGTALEACEAAVCLMENDPLLNAGTGSVLNVEGEVELDAALMDGSTLAYGAVANVHRIRNPITLARHVLLGPATLLVGEGAERFAISKGMALCANEELVVERERQIWRKWRTRRDQQHSGTPSDNQNPPLDLSVGHDTVGAIALDKHGNLVAANSTGGTPFKLPGRIGDTPLVGCGLYADARAGACVCTGWGEGITRMALARRGVELLEQSFAPQSAAEHAIKLLARRVAGGNGGCILLTPFGQVGLAWNTPRMAYAYRVEGSAAAWGV